MYLASDGCFDYNGYIIILHICTRRTAVASPGHNGRMTSMYRCNIVPRPNQIQPKEGIFAIPREGRIEDFVTRTIDTRISGAESYRLNVCPEGITISAGTPRGLFYAMQSVRQLIATSVGQIPCMCICDEPTYPYRAFMIDCARHFFSVADLKKMIDAAALFKMNVFHWHLTDDQGWRIEIKEHPRLTKISSLPASSDFGGIHADGPYEGIYTQGQLREIVDYCAERYIEVVPEFDMPGHTSAVLAAYPAFSCTGGPFYVQTKQGIFQDILCAGKEETFHFLFDVLEEMLSIFPSRYIHIGGDEAPKVRWKACLDCQARMKAEDLPDEQALQGYFMNRVISWLRARGRTAVVWNESLRGGNLDPSAVVQMRMDKNGECARWANGGGKVIVSDFYHYYCDYPYAMTPLWKTYRYRPALKDVRPIYQKNILGVEAPVWTEYIETLAHMSEMCYPRFAAVAEAGWTREERRNAGSFERRFQMVTPLLAALGIHPAAPQLWNPHSFARLKGTAQFFLPKLPFIIRD